LQRAFQPVGNLLHGIIERGAGPAGRHDHRLDDKGRVFVAAEAEERRETGDRRRNH
jgi:hypothetical protein